MIQLTNVFCVPAISDYNMRLILLSVIQLSGGHCSVQKWSTKNDLIVLTITESLLYKIKVIKVYFSVDVSKIMWKCRSNNGN